MIMNPLRKHITIILLYISLSFLYGSQIKSSELYKTTLKVATFLYLEFGLDYEVVNAKSNKPNDFDIYFRNRLRWKENNLEKANSLSDFILYGSLLNSIAITPIVSKNKFFPLFLTNLDVIATNGIVTNIVKEISKRERPSSYYNTISESNDEAYRSFFSGHTSTTFAAWTSTATILSDSYPNKRNMIWTLASIISLSNGYLRIAADKHYILDVITGAAVGYTVAKLILKKNKNKSLYFKIKSKNNFSTFHIGIPLK